MDAEGLAAKGGWTMVLRLHRGELVEADGATAAGPGFPTWCLQRFVRESRLTGVGGCKVKLA